jgi:hypothetical protein
MTCARLASMFAAAAVATLFQAGPIGAQPMTETRISTAIIPVEHVVVRTKKPYIKAAIETRLSRLDSDIRSLLRENKVDELRAADRLLGDGTPVENLPGEIVMPATAVVDAALAGLDQGEFATVPSLPNLADWNAYEAARQALMPNLSRAEPAARLSGRREAPPNGEMQTTPIGADQ